MAKAHDLIFFGYSGSLLGRLVATDPWTGVQIPVG